MIHPALLASWLAPLALLSGSSSAATVTSVVPTAFPSPSTAIAIASLGAVPTGIAPTADEQRSLELVNRERQRQGLAVLNFDPTLCAAARAHSREMAEQGYFSHVSPTSSLATPMQRYLSAHGGRERPEYLLVGENIFYCSKPDTERSHQAFMESEGHRKNLLDPRYETGGIGIYIHERGEYFVTQMFLKRRG